jgi:hypothetical protein
MTTLASRVVVGCAVVVVTGAFPAAGPAAIPVRPAAQGTTATPAPAPTVPPWPAVTFAPPAIEQQRPELRRLRDRLLAAIRDRRIDRVRALMAPTVTDQTEQVPADEILASFGPLEPGTSLPDEWQALEQALRLGGVLRKGVYVVPFIEREEPAWRTGTARLFVAGENVEVHTEPEATAPLVGRISYALLQEAVGAPTRPGAAGSACPDWTPVIGPERGLAWVCTTATRPVSGLYYAFTRAGGAWKLTRIYSLSE